MNNKETQETEHQEPQRQPYEPPKATFVPIKLEERLLGCSKTIKYAPPNGACVSAFGS